jgi:hypothetical protein
MAGHTHVLRGEGDEQHMHDLRLCLRYKFSKYMFSYVCLACIRPPAKALFRQHNLPFPQRSVEPVPPSQLGTLSVITAGTAPLCIMKYSNPTIAPAPQLQKRQQEEKAGDPQVIW